LPEIVAAFHYVTAATVNEQGKVGGLDLAVYQYVWPIREVSDPEIVNIFASPTTTHFAFKNAQFKSGSSVLLQVAIEGRAWDFNLVEIIEKEVNGAMRPFGLITLDLDGFVDDFLGHNPGVASVGTILSGKSFKTASLVYSEFSLQRGKRWLFLFPIREKAFLSAEFLEKPVRLPRFNLIKDNRV
jgi:hypothetical protein